MIYLFKKFILAILLLSSLSTYSFAQEKVYVVGVENIKYFPHFTYSNGVYGGFASELLSLFAKKYGYTFIYKARPISRLFSEYLVAGKFDFKYPDNIYWQSDMKKGKNVTYSKSVANYIDGVMVLPKNKNIGINSLKVLGTIRGFTAWDYLGLVKDKKVQLANVNNFNQLVKKTISSKFDGAYINIDVAKYLFKNTMKKPNILVFNKNLPHTKGSYHLSSIKHPNIIKEFNDFLENEKVEIDSLKKRYDIH